MGKTAICRTLAMSTVIIVLCSCTVTMCTCVCAGVSKNFSLVWPDPFLAQGVYRLQYKHLAKALSTDCRYSTVIISSQLINLKNYKSLVTYLHAQPCGCQPRVALGVARSLFRAGHYHFQYKHGQYTLQYTIYGISARVKR